MPSQAGESPISAGPDVAPLRRQAIDAVKVIFNRAIKQRGPDAPLVEDEKSGLNPSGALQNCEFGMMLLLVSTWLKDESLPVRE